MDPVTSGILVVVVLLVLMAIGTPIAFALGAVSLGALILDQVVDRASEVPERGVQGPSLRHELQPQARRRGPEHHRGGEHPEPLMGLMR